MEAKTSLSELNGVGPKSRAMLARAGITTIEQLRKLGSIEAYVRTKKVNATASLNLLWGLESLITGEHWRDVAKNHRTSLLLALEDREKNV
ncbi:MAG: TfoX/Sxy family protein [Chromatiales bacterium]|jgi:DNA transformation protein|nr:TfoX/Sxy family protein [Chromatiales bacterium]